jgi:TetR/AcrR family fatty acid metabolism transcriptional regulator
MKNSNNNSTRKKIINATLKLFVKNGYHGTSISQISSATKLTKGAIYFHFKSKYALLKEILEEYEGNFLDKIIEEVESSEGNGLDKMKIFLKSSINFAAKNQDLIMCHTNLATELCSSNRKYEKEIKRIYEKFYKFIANLLEKGKEDGSFRKDIDANVLALNLIGANEGNLVQWSINKNKCRAEDFSRSFMKFFLKGICRYE